MNYIFARHSRSAVRASDILIRSYEHYKFVTYLVNPEKLVQKLRTESRTLDY